MGRYIRKTDTNFRRLTPEKKTKLDEMWANNLCMGKIARALDVEGATVRRYLKSKGFTNLSRYRAQAKRAKMTELLIAGKSPTEVAQELTIWPNYAVRELRLLIADGRAPAGKFYQTEYVCGTCGKRVLSPVYGVFHPTRSLDLQHRFCSKGCATVVKSRIQGARICVSPRAPIGAPNF